MCNRVRLVLAAIALGMLASTVGAVRDDKAIDPKADRVVRELSDHLRGLERFRARIRMEMSLRMQGMSQRMDTVSTIAVEKPNKLAMVTEEGMLGGTTICDGTKLYSYYPMFGDKYMVKDAPATLDKIGEEEMGMVGVGMDAGTFGSFLYAADPYATLMEGVNGLAYLGEEDRAGGRCHHLAFKQDDFDWELWVRAGEQPLPVRIVPDLAKMYEQMGMDLDGQEMKMEFAITFQDWSLNAALPADQFVFAPPEGAERVESFFELFDMGFEPEEHPLLGQPAPAFDLELLEGGRLQLAAHRGKDVVILDFWATWCAPCVKALPALAEVAQAYAGRGVALYAVNLQETPEKVRRFLESKEIKVQVPMDAEGKVGALYQVQGIPQTVLIDKEGTIQAVHVGFIPGLKEKLGEELDALLAGKKLAGDDEDQE